MDGRDRLLRRPPRDGGVCHLHRAQLTPPIGRRARHQTPPPPPPSPHARAGDSPPRTAAQSDMPRNLRLEKQSHLSAQRGVFSISFQPCAAHTSCYDKHQQLLHTHDTHQRLCARGDEELSNRMSQPQPPIVSVSRLAFLTGSPGYALYPSVQVPLVRMDRAHTTCTDGSSAYPGSGNRDHGGATRIAWLARTTCSAHCRRPPCQRTPCAGSAASSPAWHS